MEVRVVSRMRAREVVTARLLAAVLLGLTAAAIWLSSASIGAAAALGSAGQTDDATPRVLATTIDTSITPVIADQIADGLGEAVDGGYSAYVIELDTPGGLVDAMRDIVTDILASPVPVIVYVSPEGARAGSAGAIITFASHVAVMAPGTTIGAATPVGLEGEEVSDKIVNDAAAQAESLAQLRGRNVEFAGDTVRDGRSATAEEAVEIGAVDAEAATLPDALLAADGRVVTVAGQREVTVDTGDATVDRYDLGFLRKVLQFLADPTIAFLLLTLGTLGLIFELANPGVGIAGTTGATALLLALFSLSMLPVNVVGVLLLILAAALFIAEALAPGFGGFAAGGAVVLLLSAVFLFDDAEGVSVDMKAAIPLALLVLAAALLMGRVARRTRHEPSLLTGMDVFKDRTVPVRRAEGTTGTSYTEGAWWSLRSTGAPLTVGSKVRVVGVDGLVLLVDPQDSDDEAPATQPEQGKAVEPGREGP
jgi:membrane-bound serine protease (ClpP class)